MDNMYFAGLSVYHELHCLVGHRCNHLSKEYANNS